MSEARYIGFDFETGGTNPDVNPILTGYFAALDKDLNVVDELELKVIPDEQYSTIEEEALKVNGIDMEAHIKDPEALTRIQAREKLMGFLAKNGAKNPKDKNKPRPLGHNVAFDIGFSRQLITKDEWEARVHYGSLCTFTLVNVLKDVGLLPETVGNLLSLVKYFNIKLLNAHTAKDDVLMMISCYASIVKMLKALTESGSSLGVDTLSMLEK